MNIFFVVFNILWFEVLLVQSDNSEMYSRSNFYCHSRTCKCLVPRLRLNPPPPYDYIDMMGVMRKYLSEPTG